MYNRGSNKKRRVSYGTFDKTDEPFFGFPHDRGKSQTYYNLFQKVRKFYLNPLVVVERVPGNYLQGGRVSKRVGSDVKLQRKSRKVSGILFDEVDTKRARTSARLSGKSVMESQALDHDMVLKVSEELIKEKENGVQAQLSSDREIHPADKVVTKRARARPKRCGRSRVKVKSRRINVDDSQHENKVETKRAMRHEKPAEDIELGTIHNNVTEWSEEGSKRCACHGEIECNGSDMDICDSPLQVQSEYVNFEVPQEKTAGNEESIEVDECKKRGIPLDSNIETKRGLVHERFSRKSLTEVEPQLVNVTSEVCANHCSYQDKIGSNGFGMDVSDSVLQFADRMIKAMDNSDQYHPMECHIVLENEREHKPSPSSATTPDKPITEFDCRILDDDISRKSEESTKSCACQDETKCDGSDMDVCDSPITVDEVIVDKNASVRGTEVQSSRKCAIQLDSKIETKRALGSTRRFSQSGADVETQLLTVQTYEENCVHQTGSSTYYKDVGDSVLRVPDEVIVAEDEKIAKCSETSKIHLNTQQFRGFPQFENLQINTSWKSIDPEEPIDERIGKVVSNLCSSEEAFDQVPREKMWTLLKPCVVRLERVPEIEEIVRRAYHDTIHYPVAVMAGHKMSVDVYKHRRSVLCQQKTSVDVKARKKRFVKKPSGGNTEGCTRIDLSDGLTLKKFCELKSISLIDSSSDEGNGALEACPSSPALPHVLENRASSLSQELVERVSSPNRPTVELDLPNSAQTLVELDPSADTVVSENPVPSGVQALNELGFLEHESFQFGKDHPSESIWSDVLDFGEAEESDMDDTTAPRRKYTDLLPLPSEDNMSCLKTLKRSKSTPMASVRESKFRANLKSHRKMPYGVLRNQQSKKRVLKKRKLESQKHPSSGSAPSNVEYVTIDTLMSNDDVEELHNEKSRITLAESVGESEFLSSLIRPSKLRFNDSRKRVRKGIINKERKRRKFLDDPHEMDDYKKARDRVNGEKKRTSRDLSDVVDCIKAQDLSPKSKAVKSFSRKHNNIRYARENVIDEKLEAYRASRELKYRLSTSWLTKNFKVEKENSDESLVGDIKSEGIKFDVPTSEKLYRDLSTIPYIYKCNLQNRCRKCKNLNPCANANKKFKLFFTLTVGVGRRLSKPLIETLQDGGDSCKINRTTAFIAASAVISHPITILVPAYPDIVQRLLPVYHSNLLMQLVAETDDIDKQEKKSHSDMAIAEALQFKRALIAMKSRHPTEENQDPPQSMQSQLDCQSVVCQSQQPRKPFMYKPNQIIAMKSKVDNKFRFVKKCLVSILRKESNKEVHHPMEEDKKCAHFTEPQLIDSQEDQVSQFTSGSPSKVIATLDLMPDATISKERSEFGCGPAKKPVLLRSLLPKASSDCQQNKIIGPSPEKASSRKDENHNESIEPISKKPISDPPFNELSGSNSNISNIPDEIVPQILQAFSLNDAANDSKGVTSGSASGPSVGCTSDINLSSQKSEYTQNVDNLLGDDSISPSACVYSNNPEPCTPIAKEPVNSSAGSEIHLNEGKSNMTAPYNEQEPHVQEMVESSLSNQLLQAQSVPDNRQSKNHLRNTLPLTTIQEKRKHPEPSSVSAPKPAVLDLPAREETPDVILVPEEVESIDLTAAEEDSTNVSNDPFPKWAVICSSLPELGFIRVQKVSDKLLIYDKAVVPDPFELDSMQELSKFLNARLADLSFPHRKKITLQWILVTSGYLVLKTIPHTNPLFWLPPHTAWKTLTDIRSFAKRYGLTKNNTSSSGIVSARSSSQSKTQTMQNGQIKPAPGKNGLNVESTSKVMPVSKYKLERSGKMVRINGHSVVMGTPANYSKPQRDTPDLSSSTGQTVESISSTGSVKFLAGSTISAPMNRFRVATVSSSGSRILQTHMVYTNSSEGYVPLMGNPASSVVQAESPASSTKSLSKVPNQPSTSAVRVLMLPKTKPASRPTSVLLTSNQPATTNSLLSSPPSGASLPATVIRYTTPLSVASISSASKSQTSTSYQAPRMSHTNTVRASSASIATKVQTLSSIQAPRMSHATTSLVSSAATNQAPMSLLAPSTRQTTAICAPSVSSAPRNPTSTTSLALSPSQTSKVRKPYKQIMVKPGYVKYVTLASIVPGSVAIGNTTAQSNSKISGSASESIKEIPGVQSIGVSSAAQTTTVSSSLKPHAVSTSAVRASTALSQKLAEALSQQLVPKATTRSSPFKNRPILILRKGSAGIVGKSNQIKFLFQKQ